MALLAEAISWPPAASVRGHLPVRGGQGRGRRDGRRQCAAVQLRPGRLRCCRRLPCSRPGVLLERGASGPRQARARPAPQPCSSPSHLRADDKGWTPVWSPAPCAGHAPRPHQARARRTWESAAWSKVGIPTSVGERSWWASEVGIPTLQPLAKKHAAVLSREDLHVFPWEEFRRGLGRLVRLPT